MIDIEKIKRKLDEKERIRNQIYGRRQAVYENLGNMGHSSLDSAIEERESIRKKLKKVKEKYEKNSELFIKQFGDLIND